MSDYIVHGKKGNGKSLVVIGRIRDALLAGKKVATNLNLNLEKMLPAGRRDVCCYRLPDRPTVDDLEMIGIGSEKIDEDTYGLVVLDECAAMLNSRDFSHSGRQAMLDWFVHSRKLGWDTYFICQNPNQIDKQVREALVELSVSCKRLDKIRVPFIGSFTKHFFGFELRAPKIHVASVRYGLEKGALINDRWTYRGRSLYECYDTRQVFRENYADGVFSYLSPWHIRGRHLDAIPPENLRQWLKVRFSAPVRAKPQQRQQSPLVALLARLPPDQRLAHYHRLQLAGAL